MNAKGHRFWNWVTDEKTEGESPPTELRIDGYIAEESWFADDVTPTLFRDELSQHEGDITVWINSGGGDVFAASQIYTMLNEHKGKVTVKIDALAASAASVIAMAGNEVLMSPVGYLMIHNPATQIMGEVSDLERGIEMLGEVKEGIINAYQKKTGLSRTKIAKMMDAETYLNAKAAVKLGFADGVLYGDIDDAEEVMFNRATPANAVASAFRRKLTAKIKPPMPKLPLPEPPKGTAINAAMERLNLISGGNIHV